MKNKNIFDILLIESSKKMYNEEVFSTILGGSIILILILGLFLLAFITVYIIGLWKLFKKAGKNGWEAIIPFYSTYVLIEIAGLNWWYFLIAISGTIVSLIGLDSLTWLTNIATLAVNFFVFYNIAKKMKKSPVGFGVAAIFVSGILAIVLGFSKDEYDSSIPVSPNGPIGDNESNNTSNEPERYCLGCGQKLKPNTQFCENCGKKVE